MHTRSQIPSAAALAGLVESACSGQRDLFAAEGRQAAELGGLDEDRRREIEQVLLQRMVDRPMPPARLRDLARRLAETFERETMAERHRAARAERFVTIEPDRDGMAWLSVRLPSVDAVAAHQRTRAIARGLHAAATATQQGDLAQDAPAADRRTFSQLHADVVRDLAGARHLWR